MRISSMKSVVTALSITGTLLFTAVPTATAGPAQTKNSSQATREREDAKSDRFAGVRQFINRALRRIGTYSGPSVPIPKAPVEESNP